MISGIVDRHHGCLEIESEAGKGTLIRICLQV
jgi:signal transduction histidine kinase